MRGIGLKVASVTVFVGMATLIKAAKDIPPGELVFFRSFFAFFPILIFMAMRKTLHSGWKTKRLPLHIFRGFIGVTAMLAIFSALTRLPFPEAITLGYATPLLLVVLSALILKEQIRIYRWSAVLVGLFGVLIVIWPRLTLFTSGTPFSSIETIGVSAALIGATLAAFATLATRVLVQTEASATVVFYFAITSSLLALTTLPFGWVMPNPTQWIMLICAGIAGGIGQILLTECYRHASISIIAPFEYTSLLISVVLGYLIFGDIPTLHMLSGGAIIIAAGIFIILRERRLGLERAKARKVSTPQG